MENSAANPQGDRTLWLATFDAMVRRMRPALLRFFGRRTGSTAIAEELTQDLFLRLLRRPDLFELENVEGYIFEAASNLARDRARREAVRGGVHVELEAETLGLDEPDPEQVVDGRKRLEAVLAAVEALPPRARDVFVLRRFESLSYAQIAVRLGISISAVEKRMAKALGELERLR